MSIIDDTNNNVIFEGGKVWSFSFLDRPHSDEGYYQFACNFYTTPENGFGIIFSGLQNESSIIKMSSLVCDEPPYYPDKIINVEKQNFVHDIENSLDKYTPKNWVSLFNRLRKEK